MPAVDHRQDTLGRLDNRPVVFEERNVVDAAELARGSPDTALERLGNQRVEHEPGRPGAHDRK
eukprot:5768736-Alexandrium_andersonii.AAC.1